MKYSVFDTHCDTLCRLHDNDMCFEKGEYQVNVGGMSKYKSYFQTFACFIAPEYRASARERCLELIDTFYTNKMSGILSIEGGECIESLADLRNYHRLGVRLAALTWNHANHIASGADECEGGFTQFGKSVLHEMNSLGMFLDVSHLNDRSFYDGTEIAHNVIASHSCARAVCNHRRNITDDMFNVIKSKGGCVGINFYPPFLNESGCAAIDDIVKHVEHFLALGGENCVGIGADYDGVDCLPEGISGCRDTYKLFDRMAQLNYSDELIEKISCKNFERVLGRII